MKKQQSIDLLEARLNRLERNKKENTYVRRKLLREIERLKKEPVSILNTQEINLFIRNLHSAGC